jgi:hypothetical protein
MLKVYGSLWLVVSIAIAALSLIGYMSVTMVIVFGFIIFGLIFMGMIGVLPTMVSHPSKRLAPPKLRPTPDQPGLRHRHGVVHA